MQEQQHQLDDAKGYDVLETSDESQQMKEQKHQQQKQQQQKSDHDQQKLKKRIRRFRSTIISWMMLKEMMY